MFFKRIEISGFKSFGVKTEVQFLPGVTVVVGPNGCGKSNVFDAIKWALGEKSPKSLRGSKMGDVIFNGCATHKPAAYAQVNLFINNEDRKIPIDFNEICVGRRLYRTGESEYFLNKTACRLRDVYDLFMDTGVGTDSYSVMQQHQVDQIILAKPRERRYIFEEAAGISKYKTRKEEALRKLLRTEEDLVRLNDLIVEIQKNVGSLKRAASRAERYKVLNAEKTKIEMRYLYLQHQTVDEQLKAVKKEFEKTDDRLNQVRAKINLLESQNEEAQLESEDLTRRLSKTQQRNFEITNDIEKREHSVNLLNERIKNLEERKKSIDLEISRSGDTLKELLMRKEIVEAEYKEVFEQYKNLDSGVKKQEEVYVALKAEHEMKLSSLDEKRSEINKRISEKIKLDNEKRVAETMLEKISRELSESQNELESIQAETESLFISKNEAQQKLIELADSLKELNEKYDVNRKKIADLEKDEKNARSAMELVSVKIRQTQTRLHTLEELQENYEGYYNGVREVMKAGDNKRLKGMVGIIAKLIGLKKEHEFAIEAALGGDIQDIVALTVEDAKAAIEYLRKQDLGRATFLPLDFLNPPVINNSNRDKILSEQGVVGFARELIEYDPKIKPAIDYLFSDTIVVDNIDVAVNLGKKGFRVRAVSLKGDLLNPRGVLTGGSHKSRGLLSKERELQTTRKDLEVLHKEEAALQQNWDNIKNGIKALYKDNEGIVAEIHKCEIQFATDRKTFENLTEKHASRKKYLDQISTSWEKKQNEINEYKKTIEINTVKLQDFETIDTDLDVKVKEAEAAVERDRNVLQKAFEDLNKIKIDLSSFRERKTSMEDKVATLEENIKSLNYSQTSRTTEMESIDKEKVDIESQIKSIRSEFASLLEERDSIKSQISDHTNQQNELTGKLHEVSSGLQLMRREENELSNKKSEEQNSITRFETQRENFIHQAEENFQMALDDVLVKALEELNADMGQIENEEEKSQATDIKFLRNKMYEVREQIERLGNVNPGAIDEYNEQKERLDFNLTQQKDLIEAKDSLKKTIAQIDETTSRMFSETFDTIRKNFMEMFRKLFNGGKADLILVEEEGQDELGVEIIAQPPGKKLQNIQLLSGGEKAMTAIALLFGIFLYKPSPFCILDEIDAPLDDANVIRFTDLIREFTETTQFIVITHNKQTMALADSIYGITMEEPGISKIVSVKFEDIEASQMIVG